MTFSRERRTNRLMLLALWIVFYCSFTLVAPPLLDDADSVHAEVAREMLVRHDFVTLYANGIRYLEKAPLYYWAMAASMKVFGATAAASRLPLAFSVLALALLLESFARRAFASARAGLYAGLITLSSFGLFIFSRINIPDVLVCVLLCISLYAFHLTEQTPSDPLTFSLPALFTAAIALNLLTKGLIAIVFPLGIVAFYLLLTRGIRGAFQRIGEFHLLPSLLLCVAIAAPWHILAALANPGHGHPGGLSHLNGHWQVPLPTDGNVHGWAWFYFLNEQLYRYLNLRVPHDYDTAPLWLFLGLIAIWLMPWSAFLPSAVAQAFPLHTAEFRARLRTRTLQAPERTALFLILWAVIPLAFFTFSTRQEYYVLPALPPMILLIAQFLAKEIPVPHSTGAHTAVTATEATRRELDKLCNHGTVSDDLHQQFRDPTGSATHPAPDDSAASRGHGSRPSPPGHGNPSRENAPWRTGARAVSFTLLSLGTPLGLTALYFFLTIHAPAPGTDLATLLSQNPADYALSFGHFLDLTTRALGLFPLCLILTFVTLCGGPLAHFLLRRRNRPHAATLTLAAFTFVFLFAAHRALVIFSPTLSSKQLADAIAPQLRPDDLIAIHGEYEAASTLGFYLRRNDLHLVEGRSSNLWYGSFFPDAPPIFETRASLSEKWSGPQRIFLWQDPSDRDRPPLQLPSPIYVIANSGGKQILSNQPNR